MKDYGDRHWNLEKRLEEGTPIENVSFLIACVWSHLGAVQVLIDLCDEDPDSIGHGKDKFSIFGILQLFRDETRVMDRLFCMMEEHLENIREHEKECAR